MKVGDRVRIITGANIGRIGEILQQHTMGPGYWFVSVPGPAGSKAIGYAQLELELAPLPTKVVPYSSIVVALKLRTFQVCSRCNARNDFADPNQPDGSYVCYECR